MGVKLSKYDIYSPVSCLAGVFRNSITLMWLSGKIYSIMNYDEVQIPAHTIVYATILYIRSYSNIYKLTHQFTPEWVEFVEYI